MLISTTKHSLGIGTQFPSLFLYKVLLGHSEHILSTLFVTQSFSQVPLSILDILLELYVFNSQEE